MEKHPFDDLENIALDEIPAKRRKHQRFVKLEAMWTERLNGARTITAWPIAVYILSEHFRLSGRRPVRVSNAAARAVGIRTPRAKLRAIRELERLGLIRVKWATTRSPIITAIVTTP